jgi:hypothetical protein
MFKAGDHGWIVVNNSIVKVRIVTSETVDGLPLYPKEELGLRSLDMILNDKVLYIKVIDYMIDIKNIIKPSHVMIKNYHVPFLKVSHGCWYKTYPEQLIFENPTDCTKFLKFCIMINSWFVQSWWCMSYEMLFKTRTNMVLDSFK